MDHFSDFGGFCELRESGRSLKDRNLRVFFAVTGKRLYILGYLDKRNNGKTPRATLLKIKQRHSVAKEHDARVSR